MNQSIEICTYRSGDLPALVALINEADAYDRLDRGTTAAQLEHEMTWPGYQAETDCFLAWSGESLVGYGDLFLRRGHGGKHSTFLTWGVVHPASRRQGIGRRLLESLYRRAHERLPEIANGPVLFDCAGRDNEKDRKALFEGFGLKPVRYFVNLARPIDNGLPAVEVPAGFCLRPFAPDRDVQAVWQVDNLAFQDHWGFVGFPLEEFCHLMEMPHFRPELWLVAEEQAGGRVVGLGLNKIDPEWIARTGRQEGYVNSLAVLREYRHLGLGTALLAQSLHLLRRAGMEAAHLHADAENLTGAMRLYERLGFQVRLTNIAYQKRMREG